MQVFTFVVLVLGTTAVGVGLFSDYWLVKDGDAGGEHSQSLHSDQ